MKKVYKCPNCGNFGMVECEEHKDNVWCKECHTVCVLVRFNNEQHDKGIMKYWENKCKHPENQYMTSFEYTIIGAQAPETLKLDLYVTYDGTFCARYGNKQSQYLTNMEGGILISGDDKIIIEQVDGLIKHIEDLIEQ